MSQPNERAKYRQSGVPVTIVSDPAALAEHNAVTHLVLAQDALRKAWRSVQKGMVGRLTIIDIYTARRNLDHFIDEYRKINPALAAEMDADD